VSAGSHHLFPRILVPALLLFVLSGCPLWWGDAGSYIALQAFAPGRSPDDVEHMIKGMLPDLGLETRETEKDAYQLDGELISTKLEERPRGTWLCIASSSIRFGSVRTSPKVSDLFAKLRSEMETEFGADFVAPTPCHAEEPYWPGGDGT
jgi:hypothetical protein